MKLSVNVVYIHYLKIKNKGRYHLHFNDISPYFLLKIKERLKGYEI